MLHFNKKNKKRLQNRSKKLPLQSNGGRGGMDGLTIMLAELLTVLYT